MQMRNENTANRLLRSARRRQRSPALFFYLAEVSVSFESGSSVTYTFQEPFSVTRNHSRQSSAIYAQSSNSRESVAFSFLTTQTPTMLLTVNTYHQQYMAVILAHNGMCINFAFTVFVTKQKCTVYVACVGHVVQKKEK